MVSKEFKIGLLTVVAGALLYYGFNFLKGTDLFSPSVRYYAGYPNVLGLNISNPVYVNGLPVGRVGDFKLLQRESIIVVGLDIDQSVHVSKDATATLTNDGLFGGKAIVLELGNSAELMEPGDTLGSKMDKGIAEFAKPVADNLNTTIAKINELLDKINSTDLTGTIGELKGAIHDMRGTLSHIGPEITFAVQEYGSLATALKKQVSSVEPILAKTNVLMDSLNALQLNRSVNNLNETLERINVILATLQTEEGTVGKLLNNDSLHDNLNKLLVDLDKLTIHFNNYPKDFLKPLSRKNKKLKGVGEGAHQ